METDASAAAPTAPPREIRSGRDLIAALHAPDPATRFAALRAIHAQPDAARAFGLVEGRDVIDTLLLRAARLSSHDSEWVAVAAALSVFRDKRVAAFFVDVLETVTRPDLLFSAARYLAADAAVLRNRLRPLLLQDGCVARARAVASLFVSASSSDPAERLRVALAAEGAEPPPVDDGSVDAWLAELDGAFREEACVALERAGAHAFAYLMHVWDRLSDENREWLAAWGLRAFPDRAEAVLNRALASDAKRVVLVALDDLAVRRNVRVDPTALRRFAHHADADLRRAAIAAGAPDVDLRGCAAGGEDMNVRLACVSRLAEAEGVAALPDLLGALRDDDWRMRAAATRALVSLGDVVVESLEPLIHDASQGVRVAAAQALLALREQAWVDAALHANPSTPAG